MLLLEDLHWADEATLDAARRRRRRAARHARCSWSATARPTLLETRPHWGEGLDFHTRLPLASLSRRETGGCWPRSSARADHVPAGAQPISS